MAAGIHSNIAGLRSHISAKACAKPAVTQVGGILCRGRLVVPVAQVSKAVVVGAKRAGIFGNRDVRRDAGGAKYIIWAASISLRFLGYDGVIRNSLRTRRPRLTGLLTGREVLNINMVRHANSRFGFSKVIIEARGPLVAIPRCS